MQTTADIDLWGMAVLYGMLLVPLAAFHALGLGLTRRLLIGVVRMSVQLALVGVYLGVIFRYNTIWLNVGWVMVMVVVANVHTLRGAGLRTGPFFATSFLAIAAGMAVVAALFIGVAIRPTPLYDARYLVPICGMILGNCLRSNIVALERFFSGIRENRKELETYLALGATQYEAVSPFMARALTAAVMPSMTTMATMGIVSLPGMMTGQLLGGSVPLVAIKYQIAIMLCIFTAMTITSVGNLVISVRVAFDGWGNLRADCCR